MDSLILETVIGLVFVFATFAALVAFLTEAVTRFLGLRAEYLLRGLRTLLDGGGDFRLPISELIRPDLVKRRTKELAAEAAAKQTTPGSTVPTPAPGVIEPGTGPAAAPPGDSASTATSPGGTSTDAAPTALVSRVLAAPLIRFTQHGAIPQRAGDVPLTSQDRRSMPSYISGRTFARALLSVMAPDPAKPSAIDDIKAQIQTLPEGGAGDALIQLVNQSGENIDAFRRSVEQWYDDHMDRVSGWYKRHVRWISILIGLLLVITFNVGALSIAKSLYTDEAMREAVVSQAADAAQCEQGKEPAECLRDLRSEIEQVRSAGLPIGWGTVPDCAAGQTCDPFENYGFADPNSDTPIADFLFFFVVIAGWILMVLTLLPGARFWFDALSRLGSLRSSGPKPPPADPVR